MSLSRNRAHDFPSDERPVTCTRCGFTLHKGQEKRDLCSGMNQRSRLKTSSTAARKFKNQRSSLSSVSDSNSGRPNRDEGLMEYVRQQPCVACGRPPPSDPHHVRSRGAGFGDRLEDGTSNVVSLCRPCHDQLDSVGGGKETFQAEHGISLEEEAKRIGREYRDRAQIREGQNE